ncbi:MAG: conserved secreted protein [Phycisphaerales bacterium]|nr:conserved secreted protein [Phycisphaerales bacterium]
MPIMRQLAAALFLLVLGSVSTGCSTLVKWPTVALRSTTLGQATPTGVTVNFDLDLTNPNSFSLPVNRAQYKLALGGVVVVNDSAAPDATIPANGTIPLRIPVAVTFESLLAAGEALRKSGGDVPYNLDGNLEFGDRQKIGDLALNAPLHFTGTLPLRQILKDPQVLLQSPAARKLAEQVWGGLFDR